MKRLRWDVWLAWGLALVPVGVLLAFVWRYGGSQYPYSDGFLMSMPLALDTVRGQVQFSDLFQVYNGHRVVFSRLTTVLLAMANRWDPRFEVWVNVVLGLINFGLVVAIARRAAPHIAHWLAVPLAVLLLSPDFGMTWLVGVYSQWHFVLMFTLFMMVTLQTNTPNIWRVVWGAVWALLAVFSSGSGVLAWGMMVLMLVMFGYRRGWYYAVPLVGLGLSVWLYTLSPRSSTSSDLPTLWQFIEFNLIYWGRPLGEEMYSARWFAVAAAVITGVNLLAYPRLTGRFRDVGVWLPLMAYGVGSGALVGLTRFNHLGGSFLATVERYVHTGTLIWVGYVAIAFMTTDAARRLARGGWRGLLVGANLAVLVAVTWIYASNYRHHALYMDYDIPVWQIEEHARCFEDHILYRDVPCTHDTHVSLLQINYMAAWRLGGFAKWEPELALPLYVAGERVVINTTDDWEAVHVRDWLLAGVPPEAVLHLSDLAYPDDRFISQIPTPLTHTTDADTPADFVGDAPGVWVIDRPTRTAADLTPRLAPDFLPVNTIPLDTGQTITRYLPPAPPVANRIDFGVGGELRGWLTNGSFNRCEMVSVATWWDDLPEPVGAVETRVTVALIPADWSQSVVTIDREVSGVVDERYLMLPCDLPAGEYLMALGVYTFDTNAQTILDNIPAADGNYRIELARVHIEEG